MKFFLERHIISEHLKDCLKPWFRDLVTDWVVEEDFCKDILSYLIKNMARVRNCPAITILNLFCLFSLYVYASMHLFITLSFLSCLSLLSWHRSDQMYQGSQVSKVNLCVKILKWHWLTESLTNVRYRAARAAKNHIDPSKKVTWHSICNSCCTFLNTSLTYEQ